MSRSAWMPWLWACIPVIVAGCADNSMVLKGKLSQAEQQQVALQRQYQQLQDRSAALDRDNQEMGTLLAQARQEAKVSEERLALTQEQLRSTTAQLVQSRTEKDTTDKRVQALTASMQRQGGIPISPNVSLSQNLPAINIPGVFVRRDGDVVRIELSAAALFEGNSAQLRPGAVNLIGDVAAEIAHAYPDQIVAVEGHTDNSPMSHGQWRDSHEMSLAWATAVYDVLVMRTRLQADQLYMAGHGPNHPIVSNATSEGIQRNRRVELVVYPDQKPERRN